MSCARFAVFARRARVLLVPSQATRNLSFPEVFSGARHVVVSTGCYTGLVRDGLQFPLDDTWSNKYAHVVVVREQVLRTLCSVCATGARVAHPFPSNW